MGGSSVAAFVTVSVNQYSEDEFTKRVMSSNKVMLMLIVLLRRNAMWQRYAGCSLLLCALPSLLGESGRFLAVVSAKPHRRMHARYTANAARPSLVRPSNLSSG